MLALFFYQNIYVVVCRNFTLGEGYIYSAYSIDNIGHSIEINGGILGYIKSEAFIKGFYGKLRATF